MPESVGPSERVVSVPPVGARTPREAREQEARRKREDSKRQSKEAQPAPEPPPDETPHALDVEV